MIKSLDTTRLTLRQPDEKSLETVRLWLKNPEIMHFLGGTQNDEQVDKVLQRIQTHWDAYGFGHFLIFFKDQHDPIGLVSLKYLNEDDAKNEILDLGFMIKPEFWKKGFAVEAAQALLKYAKEELGFTRVQALTYPENTAGKKTLTKLGFQLIGQKESITYGRSFGMASQWEIELKN
jgi:RimJ/RimL family protein N-acetyltransferase